MTVSYVTHSCDDMPIECSIRRRNGAIIRKGRKVGKWTLRSLAADGPITGIRFCPWCGQGLEEN